MISRTASLWNAAVYQVVKYMTNGTATRASVVMTGNVTTRASGARMARSSRWPARGNAAMARVSGRPRARNSGASRSSRMVWNARM